MKNNKFLFVRFAGLLFLALASCTGPVPESPGNNPGGGVIQLQPESPQDPAPGGSAGSWWEVYFTDPLVNNNPEFISGSLEEVLLDQISQAQARIDIAAFEFDLTPVAEALIEAHLEGVQVRWITDDEHGLEADEDEEDRGQFSMLQEAGIDVISDDRSALMHNKFIIFDGQTVWTGSTNLTQNGVFRNNNNAIILRDAAIAAIYTREFEEMWAGEFGPRSPSTTELQAAEIDGVPIQILFGSEDEVIDWLIPLVDGAERSIRFMAFSFTHDDLGAAVFGRAQAGVDVAGIFETRGSETEHSEMTALYCTGVPVRQDGNPGTMHHKVIVIDGEILVTGSLNFSNNANDSNDENVLLIADPQIAARYLQEFNRLWNQAEEPELDCG